MLSLNAIDLSMGLSTPNILNSIAKIIKIHTNEYKEQKEKKRYVTDIDLVSTTDMFHFLH